MTARCHEIRYRDFIAAPIKKGGAPPQSASWVRAIYKNDAVVETGVLG